MLPRHAGILTEAVDGLRSSMPPARGLAWIEEAAAGYEASRRQAERGGAVRAAGTWYTPPGAVERLLDVATAGARGRGPAVRACDPACGTGNVLVAIAERLRGRGRQGHAIAAQVAGMDIDPMAVAIARVRMQARFGGGIARWAAAIRCGDALEAGAWDGHRFDLVAGNPPFLGQLGSERRSAREREALRARFGGTVARYADAAGAFLLLGTELAPHGTVALVQPLSTLAAGDALSVRRACEATHRLRAVLVLDERTFGAAVRTCVPVLAAGRSVARVQVWAADGSTASVGSARCGGGAWGAALAAARGVPDPAAAATLGTLGDWMTATADFRDQYYGLRGRVREERAGRRPTGAFRLVTVGAIGAARLDWGDRPTRLHGRTFRAPVVRAADLAPDARMAAWLQARRGPKVLVASQTRVIEAWTDAAGRTVPSVPVVTARPRRALDLWHVAAALLAPSTSAEAWWRHAGAALSSRAIRVSASQLAALPAPGNRSAWDRGAVAVRAWQRTGRAADRARFMEAMAEAFGVPTGAAREALHAWWEASIDGG